MTIHWKDWYWSSNIWPSDARSQFIEKAPDAGKDWGREEKGVTEDGLVRWHHWLNGQEFEQTPRDSEGQRSLVCCSPRGRKESDMTYRLNNNNTILLFFLLPCLAQEAIHRVQHHQSQLLVIFSWCTPACESLRSGTMWPQHGAHSWTYCSFSVNVCRTSDLKLLPSTPSNHKST